MDAGGHVEIRQLRPAERAGRRFQTRQLDPPQLRAVLRVETCDASPVTEGDPEISVRIDGHAVRRRIQMRGGNDATQIPQMTVDFVIEREHFLARGIDVKHRFSIGGPGDAVRIRHRAERFMQREVRIEPVEFRIAGFFHQADGSREKPAVGRAFSVVEAVVRQVLLGIRHVGEHAGFLVQQGNPVIARDDQSAALAGNHGADAFADVPRALATVRRIEPMHAVALDVHIVKRALPPHRAFAPLAVDVSDCFDFDHAAELRTDRESAPREI